MNDSLQKIINDMRQLATICHESGYSGDINHYAARLEALQKQPVAWMHVYGNSVLSDSARARNADMSGNHFGYTVPLIRAD